MLTSCGQDPDSAQQEVIESEVGDGNLYRARNRLKWLAYSAYIDAYIGRERGIYEKYSLDIDVHEGGPQIDATKLVAAGTDTFGIEGGDQVLVAQDKGLDIVVVMAIMQRSPAGFLVKSDSGITSVSDFPGRAMRVIPGHNTEIEYRTVFHRLGLNRDTVEEIVNFSELTLFRSGVVDIEPIYIVNQPPMLRVRGEVGFQIVDPKIDGIQPYGNVYFVRRELIEQNPKLVQSFVSASIDAWEYAFANPEDSVKALVQAVPRLSVDIETERLKDTRQFIERPDGRIGMMEASRWEQSIDDLFQAGIIMRRLDSSTVFTNKFVENHYAKTETIRDGK